jgi:hypothetical protein
LTAGNSAERGDQCGEDHQRLFERLAIDHPDATEVGQIGGQHGEGRPDARECLIGFGGGAGGGLQHRTQLRVGIGHLGGEPGQPVRKRPDVVTASDLRVKERARLVDQLRDLSVVGVGLVDQQP